MNLWSRDNIFSANQLWYHKKTMTSRENQQQENFLKLEKKKKKSLFMQILLSNEHEKEIRSSW